MLMVIRGDDADVMFGIISRLKKSRDNSIRELAETLENHFYDTDSNGRGSGKTGPTNKKTGGVSVGRRDKEAENTKPVTKRRP